MKELAHLTSPTFYRLLVSYIWALWVRKGKASEKSNECLKSVIFGGQTTNSDFGVDQSLLVIYWQHSNYSPCFYKGRAGRKVLRRAPKQHKKS